MKESAKKGNYWGCRFPGKELISEGNVRQKVLQEQHDIQN